METSGEVMSRDGGSVSNSKLTMTKAKSKHHASHHHRLSSDMQTPTDPSFPANIYDTSTLEASVIDKYLSIREALKNLEEKTYGL